MVSGNGPGGLCGPDDGPDSTGGLIKDLPNGISTPGNLLCTFSSISSTCPKCLGLEG